MLAILKYDPFAVGDSVDLIEDGEIIFTGTIRDVAEEIGCSVSTLREALKDHKGLWGYGLRVKPFKGLTKGEKERK